MEFYYFIFYTDTNVISGGHSLYNQKQNLTFSFKYN